MAIAILCGKDDTEKAQWQWFVEGYRQALLKLDPELDLRVWPDVGNYDDIEFALLWSHPQGVLSQFPNLKCIGSLGAGVDHIIKDTTIPKYVPIRRIQDPFMAMEMTQYAVATALNYIRRLDHWRHLQAQKNWDKRPPFSLSDVSVGVMGLGYIGAKIANAFVQLGLPTQGWSRTPKTLPGVETFAGQEQLASFLNSSKIIICILPSTQQTQGILNQLTLAQLPQGAYVINIARGNLINDDDLLQALDSDHIAGAYLDVFNQEPLPTEHPYWAHPKVNITPHIASVTNPETTAPQILETYRQIQKNMPLEGHVDLERGY